MIQIMEKFNNPKIYIKNKIKVDCDNEIEKI
jgi:hypothetical protein